MAKKIFDHAFFGREKIKIAILDDSEERLSIIDTNNSVLVYTLKLTPDEGGRIEVKIDDGVTYEFYKGSNSNAQTIFKAMSREHVQRRNFISRGKIIGGILLASSVSLLAVLTILKMEHYDNYSYQENKFSMYSNPMNSHYQGHNNMPYSERYYNHTEPTGNSCNMNTKAPGTCSLNSSKTEPSSSPENSDDILPPKPVESTEVAPATSPKIEEPEEQIVPINLNTEGFSVSDQFVLEPSNTDEATTLPLSDLPLISPNVASSIITQEAPAALTIETQQEASEATSPDDGALNSPIIVENVQSQIKKSMLAKELIEIGQTVPKDLADQLDEDLRNLLYEEGLVEDGQSAYISSQSQIQNIYSVRNRDKDKYGIPSIPEPNSLLSLVKEIRTPMPGGGDAESPEEFKNFGLYIIEDFRTSENPITE